MTKILFLIHDLGQGGAEKVLVNLVNNMDPEKFDITLMSLFGGGVNQQFLAPHVRLVNCFSRPFPGNSHLMKLLSPKRLHNWLVREHYDIEVSYLEGPPARIISGCTAEDTKKACWIHIEQHTAEKAAESFRSIAEAKNCYGKFDKILCVSQTVQQDFQKVLGLSVPCQVLYNTNESEKIRLAAREALEIPLSDREIKLVGMGKLVDTKGFDRMIRIQQRLRQEGLATHLYILGKGPQQKELEDLAAQLEVSDTVTFLGYQTNPYKYLARCDLFVCASHAEGFSTAATEALILGIPVCTVEVSGMKEMLGGNEYGIVTENSEEALYRGIRQLLEDPSMLAHYRHQARLRGATFSRSETVRAVEEMLLTL